MITPRMSLFVKRVPFVAVTLITALLCGCQTPDYGADKEMPYVEEVSTEIIAVYGTAIAITEKNEIIVKVINPDMATASGVTINEDGLMKVSLAAIDQYKMDAQKTSSLAKMLNDTVLNDEVLVSLRGPQQSNAVEGFISFFNEQDKIMFVEEYLLNNGLQELIDMNQLKNNLPELTIIKEQASEIINRFLK